ncbi:hypothetical protein [Acinetobacter bereziniae]|uniref:hypothetical protein n=1 Tax=Acinetobacter bereziniae TaxID=106648 RepID=UPI00124FFDAD|nr:hypothetical protein [Acinetobacter bereziniae]MBJ8477191.1 hypothetical protein [Acinetobacter bereziniae]
MNKTIITLICLGMASMSIAKETSMLDYQMQTIQSITSGIDKCSYIAQTKPEAILTSESYQKMCEIPYDSLLLNKDEFNLIGIDDSEFGILKASAASAKGIIVRNKSDYGFNVDLSDRAKFFNAPYDQITTKKIPTITCIYLKTLYEIKPKYFENKPICEQLLSDGQ